MLFLQCGILAPRSYPCWRLHALVGFPRQLIQYICSNPACVDRLFHPEGLKTLSFCQRPRQSRRIFPLVFVSRPALGSTQPPVQWVPGVLSPGVKHSRSVMLTTHPHLVPKLRMSRSYTSSHPMRLHGL
jgi:hypothetical protein